MTRAPIPHLPALAAACLLAGCGAAEAPAPAGAGPAAAPDPARDAARTALIRDEARNRWRAETLSETYTVAEIYPSMRGPQSAVRLRLLDDDRPELLWITAYRAVMVGRDGETPMPQEFMCHSNLDLELASARGGGLGIPRAPRLFTLSQGQHEVRFPDGFGVPVLSNEPLRLATQVLNLNHRGEPVAVRHKVTIEFLRDRDLEQPLVPLVMTGGQVLASLEGEPVCFDVREPSAAQRTSCSAPGEHAPGADATAGLVRDRHGRRFTLHWVVPPGRHTRRSLLGRLNHVPGDTTVHYVATHLHPFAESMELRDLTAGEVVYRSGTRAPAAGIGLAHVDHYASVEGLRVYGDHDYGVAVTYDNTTAEPQDSMAVMFVYARDARFDPTPWRAAACEDAAAPGALETLDAPSHCGL